jgi:hypothetical protein
MNLLLPMNSLKNNISNQTLIINIMKKLLLISALLTFMLAVIV